MTGLPGSWCRPRFRDAAMANAALPHSQESDTFGHLAHRVFQGESNVLSQISPTSRTLATEHLARDVGKNGTKGITGNCA
ncbi:hypothetical protein, partial [Salmonella enterica]|uniref:hypothetical protein n=1 Tax=Salmonella enterica TaxID=28901 RepID=UPI001C437CD3